MTVERGKVYTVERGATKLRAGQGMGAGLGVIIKHFADAFTKKLDSPDETSGVFTVQYPEERLPLAEAYRNFPILLYDDANGQELCTSCFQCQRICPPQVIHMTQAKDPVTGKAVPAVSEFIIEYDACMSCGLCAEVCPFDAIKMDHEFELATDHHPGLTIDREGLNRPISYYENIAPTFWQEARDNALKKLQGNIKRRPGEIGIAPQMIGMVAGNPPLAVATTDDRRPTTAAPSTPNAPIPASADDKAARLAAIRAAKQAQQQKPEGAETAEAAGASPALELREAPADDKAARLAAIRAANAARQKPEAAEGTETAEAISPALQLSEERRARSEEQASVAESAPATESGQVTTDDKAARLAAIRAANAAKKARESGES